MLVFSAKHCCAHVQTNRTARRGCHAPLWHEILDIIVSLKQNSTMHLVSRSISCQTPEGAMWWTKTWPEAKKRQWLIPVRVRLFNAKLTSSVAVILLFKAGNKYWSPFFKFYCTNSLVLQGSLNSSCLYGGCSRRGRVGAVAGRWKETRSGTEPH